MSNSPQPESRLSWRQHVWRDLVTWWRGNGQVWIYLAKALCAAFLALGIAMLLDLPQPRTAMTTTFIVMNVQSGAVLAKSYYRICGTLVGLVAMLIFISLFAQAPELFILSTALWVGVCTFGAAYNRNFRSYGFVLAGYTAALIGFPASQHPDVSFISATTRVAEVTLGIVCAGVVSALIFPRRAGDQLRTSVRARFSSFVEFVSASLAGQQDRAKLQARTAAFVGDVVGYEATLSMAVFDSSDARVRGGRLRRLNGEFMTVSTRFHALHQLMNRLRSAGATRAIDAIEPYFKEIAPLLAKSGEPVSSASDAVHVAEQLTTYKASLPARIGATRTALAADDDAPMLDFDTAAELLYRFVDDLHAYATTYASLSQASHARERWVESYAPKTNWVLAAVGGARAVVTMLIVAAFWMASAWPSGITALLNTAAVCALAAGSPRPTKMVSQMFGGTLLAVAMALTVQTFVYPNIDGFPLLCLGLAPFLLIGLGLTTKPATFGYGFGYCVFFSTLVGPDNVVQYDPAGLMNDGLALLISMVAAYIAFAVLLPMSTPWLRNRVLSDLRHRVSMACRARLARLRPRFESGSRDLSLQLNSLATSPEQTREGLAWLFAVWEVGSAVIDLRETLAKAAPAGSSRGVHAGNAWRAQSDVLIESLATLFDRPEETRRLQALVDANLAIDAAQRAVAGENGAAAGNGDARRLMEQTLRHLHFIRTALLDPESPLVEGAGDAAAAAASASAA